MSIKFEVLTLRILWN